MKGSRHLSRSQALQILYQLDSQPLSVENGIEAFKKNFEGADNPFTERLVTGVANTRVAIDEMIGKAAMAWRVDRMARVDRNILRLGIYELLHCDDIPAIVTINEMVELAKEFGDEETPQFVNAVLDKVRIDHPRPSKVP